MLRAAGLVGMLMVVILAVYGGPTPAAAGQTCTTTCSSGSTVTCTEASGTCSSASGTVTCCGQAHTCTAIDAWNACESRCTAAYNTCIGNCKVFNPCFTNCASSRTLCFNSCGARPTTSFSC
jgi:hypothetical protein